MSSSCSSTDLGIDIDFDDILTESLINDIELFVEHIHQLRKALDVNAFVSNKLLNCETKCVQIHEALSIVSQSVRNLLVKYPNFKTSNVLIPVSQLVHSVKSIKFDNPNFDASRSLQAIERLEAAIGNVLRNSMNTKLFVNDSTNFSKTDLNSKIPQLNQKNYSPKVKVKNFSEKSVIVIDDVNLTSQNENKTNYDNGYLSICQKLNLNSKEKKIELKTSNSCFTTDFKNTNFSNLKVCYSKNSEIAPNTLNNDFNLHSPLMTSNYNTTASQASTSGTSSSGVFSSNLLENDQTKYSSNFEKNSKLSLTMSDKENANENRSASADYCTTHNNALLKNISHTTPLSTKLPHLKNQQEKEVRLIRRHSAYQSKTNKINNDFVFLGKTKIDLDVTEKRYPKDAFCKAQQMREILSKHENGMELAFKRCKAWSKYATHLLVFVRSRLALEQEHMRNSKKLAEQSKAVFSIDTTDNYLPLHRIFEEHINNSIQFANRTSKTIANLNQRFVTTLENRQKEHDLKRRKLKNDWLKQKKQYNSCVEELRRARLTLNSKEGGYLKARDLALRHEQQVSLPVNQQTQQSGGLLNLSLSSTSSDPQLKKLKELEKKRKNEEDALNRKTDAENEVWRLERELEIRRIELNDLRHKIISELCDLIRHCDLTTIACASHYFKAFSELWALVPEEYDRLAANSVQETLPNSNYMSFLYSQLNGGVSGSSVRSNSANSFERVEATSVVSNNDYSSCVLEPLTTTNENCNKTRPQLTQQRSIGVITGIENSTPSTSFQTSKSNLSGSPSGAVRRRNALHADEHYEIIAETSAHRRQKKSVARIFEQSNVVSSIEISNAAKSHKLQRTRQVTKCAHCEHLVIFDAFKCSICGIVWHKKCLAAVSVICGPSARRMTEECSAQRRMSIFGVSLKGHLEAQKRQIPLILEQCIHELQKRGMTCKGLYRTCGVKSKIEQICVTFEQTGLDQNLDISTVHPMNLASVIKLYLRRLPEPLMTYEMYNNWLQFNDETSKNNIIAQLQDLVSRLPQQNYDTLKFLILHLKRVTWFELDNLMTASNLAAVISPSLIWAHASDMRTPLNLNYQIKTNSVSNNAIPDCASFINDAHQQTKAVEMMIQHAFEIFLVNKTTDWEEFFEVYPDVAKPKIIEDSETEAEIAKKSNLELCYSRETDVDVDEDDLVDDEEEYDICDCNNTLKHQNSGEEKTTNVNEKKKTNLNNFKNSNYNCLTTKQNSSPDLKKTNFANNFFNKNSATNHKLSSSSSNFFNLKQLQKDFNNSINKTLPPVDPISSQNLNAENKNKNNNCLTSIETNNTLKPLCNKTNKNRQNFYGLNSTKQRSFTTSILVSPQTNRKFAAIFRRRNFLNSSDNIDNKSKANSNDFLVFDEQKLNETSRSYQRLTQKEDLNSVDDFKNSKKNKIKLNFENQKNQTLCSGEVVVDMKKDQFCYSSNRSLRTGKSRQPLSSASFNLANYAETSKIPLKKENSVEILTSNTLINSSKRECFNKHLPETDINTTENINGLIRRKRLERAAAHHSTALNNANILTDNCNYNKSTTYNTQLPQNWSGISNDIKINKKIDTKFQPIFHKIPVKFETPNLKKKNSLKNTLDVQLQSAVGVLFSGSDVSYV